MHNPDNLGEACSLNKKYTIITAQGILDKKQAAEWQPVFYYSARFNLNGSQFLLLPTYQKSNKQYLVLPNCCQLTQMLAG